MGPLSETHASKVMKTRTNKNRQLTYEVIATHIWGLGGPKVLATHIWGGWPIAANYEKCRSA